MGMFGAYEREGHPDKEWPHIFMTVMIALICWGIGMILMDRIEAVGNCIVTDFDSGHGGEEAVYMSFVAILFLLTSVVSGIVKSFRSEERIKVVEENVD